MNGKALLNGIRLDSIDSSDMLDVLHYMFEEDLNNSTAEQAEARDTYRTRIYEDLYETTYNYASSSNKSSSSMSNGNFEIDEALEQEYMKNANANASASVEDPLKKAVKPYRPPTTFNERAANPYVGVLDAPLG